MLKHLSITALALLLIGGVLYAQCVNCVPRQTQCCCKGSCKPVPAKTVCASPESELAADAQQAPDGIQPAFTPVASVEAVVAPNYEFVPATPVASAPPDLVVLHSSFLI